MRSEKERRRERSRRAARWRGARHVFIEESLLRPCEPETAVGRSQRGASEIKL